MVVVSEGVFESRVRLRTRNDPTSTAPPITIGGWNDRHPFRALVVGAPIVES